MALIARRAETEAPRPHSPWLRAWQRFKRNRLAVISLWFCVVLVLAAILAPVIAPHGPLDTDYGALRVTTGDSRYWLGTDELGRDILSRLIFSLRTALIIAFGAELTALVLAIAVGLASGYAGGRTEQLLMGVTDVMYAFPSYLLNVILVTVAGRNMTVICIAIGISSWVGMARLMRAQVLSMKVRGFVEAARSMGASSWTIAIKYILPNSLGPLLVSLSFGIPGAIIAEAGLSLLGLGVQPPTPSWGEMIRVGTAWIQTSPHMLLWPGLLFAITTLAFTWVGDGLRDAFDNQE